MRVARFVLLLGVAGLLMMYLALQGENPLVTAVLVVAYLVALELARRFRP